MDFETALNPLVAKNYPLSNNNGDANTLIFNSAAAADSVIKSLTLFGGFKICAKTIQGFSEPVQVAESYATSDEIFHLAIIAAASI